MKPCLADIRVLELGQVLAAPFAGMLPGDRGADVITIESPDPPFLGEHPTMVLRELVGYGNARVGDLLRQKAVFRLT